MAAMMPHIVLVGQSPVVSQIDRSHGIENGGAFGISDPELVPMPDRQTLIGITLYG